MRILMLGWEFPPHITGGLGTACEGLLKGLARACPEVGIEFVLPAMVGDELRGPWTLTDASRERAVRSLTLGQPTRPGALTPGAYDAMTHQAARFADDVSHLGQRAHRSFDLIHAHDWMTFPAALALRAATGKPLLVHIHSTVFDRDQTPDPDILRIERAGLMAAERIVAVSQYTRQVLVERFALPASKIRVVHNGWLDTPHAAGLDVEQRPPLVSFLGRITYQKGPAAFIQAAREVLDTVADAQFVMAGSGDLLPFCRRLASRVGIEPRCSFPGFLDRSASAALLARSAAFVMPSISEPFGLVALEAAAQGAPLVLSTRSGVAEIVSSAAFVDPFDHRAIAAAVRRLLTDRAGAARQAARARAEATALPWDIPARQIADLYQQMLGARSGPPEAAAACGAQAALSVEGLE